MAKIVGYLITIGSAQEYVESEPSKSMSDAFQELMEVVDKATDAALARPDLRVALEFLVEKEGENGNKG